MGVGVQHDDGERQQEYGVQGSEIFDLVGITVTVAAGKRLKPKIIQRLNETRPHTSNTLNKNNSICLIT